jgi:tRNA(Ile)-lysidine synthase
MALLLLAAAACPGRVEAATVDHRLRPESATEAADVAALCAHIGIAHAILTPAKPISGSVQAAARTARYALLHDWRAARGIDWLLTAHHADDQRETMMMRLNRSSGVGGLAGVRRMQSHLARPLLHWRHGELVALVAAAGVKAVDDPSNRDLRYDRAAMRAALADFDALDPAALARSADALADADAALDWMTARLIAEASPPGEPQCLVWNAVYPIEIKRRILIAWLRHADPALAPRGEQVTALIAALDGGTAAMIGDWRLMPPRPGTAAAASSHWHIERTPPRRR